MLARYPTLGNAQVQDRAVFANLPRIREHGSQIRRTRAMAEGAETENAHNPPGLPPDSTRRVFISYASHDAAAAQEVCSALEAAGLPCWVAPRDVKAGALYADAIVRAISSARAFVLVMSESSINSSHVGKEIERASSKKCPVIALRIDAAPLTPALEYFLSESQWVEAQVGNYKAAYAKLIDAIREIEQPVPGVVPGVPSEASTIKAGAALPKSRRKWILFAAGLAALAVATLFADRFWLSKHPMTEQPAAVATLTAATISEKSIAVLPFVDMSEKKDQEYFSDGLSEELIDMLVQVPDLRVPARTSSFYFKGKQTTIADIAKALGVSHVLEGSVRKASNTIRVTAQLIRADNGYHLWSGTYDRDLKDVFKVQDEIAGAVVSALKLKLESGQQVSSSHRTSKPEAYDQYLLGRQFFERGPPDGFRHAAESFRKATELDPGYAAAYAELALSQFYEANSKDEEQQALVAANKVVELAPDEAHGYAVRALLRLKVNWDWTGAQADFEKAVAFDPGSSRVQLGYAQLLATLGRLPEAIAATKKTTELDPLSNEAWSDLCLYLTEDRQFEAAHEAARRALEIQPESPYSLSWLGELQLLEGKAAEALATFRLVDIEEFRLWGVAMAEHTLGHANESQKALDELIAKHAQNAAYEVADVYAWRGETDKAFEWLEKSRQQREGDLVDVQHDVLITSLRGDSRYKALLRKINLAE